MRTHLLAALVLATIAGCGSRPDIGTFDASGFRHERLDYAIESQAGEVMTSAWALDNFRLERSGRPERSKLGPEYRIRRRADLDGDGRTAEMGEVAAYDLRYRSTRDAGVIWVRTIPLATELAQTELRVLMRLYVDAVSGSGLTMIDLGAGRIEIDQRRFATREVESAHAVVGGREAYVSTIDVASVDQLALSPEHRWERARIVLVRTELYWGYDDSFVRADQLRPVLMVLGYSNLPEDFEALRGDFDSLVSRVRFESVGQEVAADALACAPDRAAVSFVVMRPSVFRITLAPGADDAERSCLSRVISTRELAPTGDRAYAFLRERATLRSPEPDLPEPAQAPPEVVDTTAPPATADAPQAP